jgi:hypothetical protein
VYVEDVEQPFPSTTWTLKPDTIRPPARAMSTVARSASIRRSFAKREARKPLAAVLKLRGGPEGWVEIRARHRVYRFPGHEAVLDCLLRINAQ